MPNLKKKAIWLFAGGAMQQMAARKTIDLGYQLILTDRSPACACAKYADEFVELDTFDVKGNIRAAKQLRKKYSIEAVFTAAADCHETVAHIGKSLGVHSLDPKIARICRYKEISRNVLTKAGIPQPQFAPVKTLENARSMIKKLGGRAALKATNNSGSRGFALINHIDELTPDVFECAVSSGTTGYALIEEILFPVETEIAEQSVETVWFNGKMYWLNWVDRLFRKDFLRFESLKAGVYSDAVWGVELGHINPAVHSDQTKKEIFDLIYQAGVAIGMKKEKGGHILKADIMLTSKGPYILEATPRLSGGWDSSGSTPARGANLIGGALQLALGKKLDLNLWHEYFEYQNPGLYASILAQIQPGAKDCIGRDFAIGLDFDRERSIKTALKNLSEKNYVIPME